MTERFFSRHGTNGKGDLLRPSLRQLANWTRLTVGKYRQREGLFLAEGVKVVGELLRAGGEIEALLVMAGREDLPQKVDPGRKCRAPRYRIDEDLWRRLSQDRTPEGIMAIVRRPPCKDTGQLLQSMDTLVFGYRIGNPNNIGALVRTMHWFGLRVLLLSRGSVDVTSPKAVRSSMGSIFFVEVVQDVETNGLIEALRRAGKRVVATDSRMGVPPHPVAEPLALLLGGESHGLPEAMKGEADEIWRIPGGGADSLSMPQAAAIMIYELTKGRKK